MHELFPKIFRELCNLPVPAAWQHALRCMGDCAHGFFGSIGANPGSESWSESLRLAIFYGLGGFDTWRKEMVRKVEKVAQANARCDYGPRSC